ncbi:MAG: transcription termination/antitermination protein NusG [Myxococcota bacterium]
MSFKWYIVHTYSGFEHKAKKALEERIKQHNKEEFFGDILVPTEPLPLADAGKKKRGKKFFPSYIFVQMELNDETWHLVKNTPKITGFVGGTTAPPTISDEEVARLTQQIEAGTLTATDEADFSEGENVRVTEGPFANFNGVIDEVDEAKKKLRVFVSIFGRSTPVELEFNQVEKI